MKKLLLSAADWLCSRETSSSNRQQGASGTIAVVCISDTHNNRPDIPDGDILIHAGDLTEMGTFTELQDQLDWLKSQPHRHKIVIAGNHDLLLDPGFVDQFPSRIFEKPGSSRADLDFGDLIYLCNSQVTLDLPGRPPIKVYGSPMTPMFGTWAYQYPPIRNVWKESIPDDTDIVVTHGPPALYRDTATNKHNGCPHLLQELQRVRPTLAVFGHIHCGRGISHIVFDKVQCMYDRMKLGQVSMLAVVQIITAYLKRACGISRDKGQTTTLVNAAIMGEVKHRETHGLMAGLGECEIRTATVVYS